MPFQRISIDQARTMMDVSRVNVIDVRDPGTFEAGNIAGAVHVSDANLAEYVSGLQVAELCADLTTFVEGRALDDDGAMLLRFVEAEDYPPVLTRVVGIEELKRDG